MSKLDRFAWLWEKVIFWNHTERTSHVYFQSIWWDFNSISLSYTKIHTYETVNMWELSCGGVMVVNGVWGHQWWGREEKEAGNKRIVWVKMWKYAVCERKVQSKFWFQIRVQGRQFPTCIQNRDHRKTFKIWEYLSSHVNDVDQGYCCFTESCTYRLFDA